MVLPVLGKELMLASLGCAGVEHPRRKIEGGDGCRKVKKKKPKSPTLRMLYVLHADYADSQELCHSTLYTQIIS